MGAAARDWAFAYLQQARADLEAVEELHGRVPSVSAMLLQMVFEKLGKAALLRNRTMTVEKARTSHMSASVLADVFRRKPQVWEALGFKHPALMRQVLDVVVELEAAHPQLAGRRPQLEYPWQSASGEVCWPARHLEIARRLADNRLRLGPLIQLFAVKLAGQFDAIFP